MAVQITKEFHRLGKYLPDIVIKTAFGGVSISSNVQTLKNGCDILVGTPGRIADLVRNKHIDVSKVKSFVVDDCDLLFQKISNKIFMKEMMGRLPSRYSPDFHTNTLR